MASEITVDGTLQYDDSVSTPVALQITALSADVSSLQKLTQTQSIGTSVEAFVLGECTAPGWFMCVNIDPTNYVEIYSSTSGVVVGKLFPGESYGPVRLGSGMQAPAAKANVASCKVDYLVCNT